MNNKSKIKWTIRDVVLIYIAELIFIFVFSILFFRQIKQNPFIGAFFACILAILLVRIFLRRREEKWSSLGFIASGKKKSIIRGFFIGTILFTATKLIFYPASYIELFNSSLNLFKVFQCFFIFITFKGIVDIFLVPFTEEILSRGLLFQALLNKFSTITSIIIVSAFDSLLHIDSFQNYKWLMIRFLYFIVITWLFNKNRNLFICISAHATLNYLAWVARIILG